MCQVAKGLLRNLRIYKEWLAQDISDTLKIYILKALEFPDLIDEVTDILADAIADDATDDEFHCRNSAANRLAIEIIEKGKLSDKKLREIIPRILRSIDVSDKEPPAGFVTPQIGRLIKAIYENLNGYEYEFGPIVAPKIIVSLKHMINADRGIYFPQCFFVTLELIHLLMEFIEDDYKVCQLLVEVLTQYVLDSRLRFRDIAENILRKMARNSIFNYCTKPLRGSLSVT